MMVDKKRKVPNLRFKGFTNDWVQRNLGEVVQKVKSYSLSRDVETEDDTGFEYIHYGDIHTQKADVIDGNTKLPSIVPGDYDLVQVGDVIVADASEDYLGIAEPAVVVNKPTQNLVAGLHTIAIRPNGIHPLFLYYLLHTQLFKHFGYRTGTGLKVFSISYPNLAKFTFAMPTLDEQEAIANTLRDMDNLIAANQRKLDLLKEQKKGYLQKMFPKNGAKVPELRFAGFADAWEQRKLGDLGDILRKSIDPQLTPSREFVEYSMPSYDRGKRPNRVLGESMQSTRLKISGTVLLINKLNVRQRRIWFVKKAPKNAVASGEFVPFQSFKIDLGFLHQLFLSDKTTSELQSISSGTSNSQKRVTPSDLLHYPFCIPTTKGEQVVVGRFLSSIDNLITLHQRKLEKLQELKKGYLQKMFI